jgi:hypothetical protein
VDRGSGITEEGSLTAAVAVSEAGITATVELDSPAKIIRWDPVDFEGCEILLKEVHVKTALDEWREAAWAKSATTAGRKTAGYIFPATIHG